jgi:hypothetical protein
MRTAILKAIRSYLNERVAAGKGVNERPQTPGTDLRPEPSAPPAEEEEEECGTTHTIAVAECVVCMDGKVSVTCRAENFRGKFNNTQVSLP